MYGCESLDGVGGCAQWVEITPSGALPPLSIADASDIAQAAFGLFAIVFCWVVLRRFF